MSLSVVGIVGAGFMGSGIAESSAVVGKHVLVYEPEEAPLERSRGQVATSLQRAVSRGKLTDDDASAAIDRIVYTTRFDDLGGADAVVEAVSEDSRVKAKVVALMDEEFPEAQFLASNTSSIPIAER